MKLLCTLLASLIFFSCNVINPDEQEPSFIYVDSFSFNTEQGQGTASEAITELWVYANSDIQGVYDLPAQIPVLRNGNTTMSFFAGIKNNGMSSTRIKYPFYAGYDTILDLQPSLNYTVIPHYEYAGNAIIDDSRNFENGNFFQPYTTSNQGTIELINDANIAVDGARCVKASLDASHSYMQYIDDTSLTMTPGNTVFLELNYSCNNTFVLGVYTIDNTVTSKNPIIYLTPTTGDTGGNPTWNKIYIDLGTAAGQSPTADYHRFYFECTSTEAATPTIYLDNLKVVNW